MRQILVSAGLCVVAVGVCLVCTEAHTRAQQTAAAPAASALTIIKSQHTRLTYLSDIVRIAVGDDHIAEAILITNREVLLNAITPGRTTLTLWFANGTVHEDIVNVQRDLSVLSVALKRLNPSIEVESAPDRDAVILTGRVPDALAFDRAEEVARMYLNAGGQLPAAARPLVQATPSAPATAAEPTSPAAEPGAVPPVPPSAAQGGAEQASVATVINLIVIENLPQLAEQRVEAAIRTIGGEHVSVRRVLRGRVRDDAHDTLVLEGTVPNQVALVRVLSLAAGVFAQQVVTADDIRVVADESGALTHAQENAGTQAQSAAVLGTLGGILGSGSQTGRALNNQVERNVARAKALEVANGRIVSFIRVVDIPQIRIDIRLLEVNRTKLLTYNPQTVALLSNFHQPPLSPSPTATGVQGNGAASVGSSGTAVQNILAFLGGQLSNELQFVSGKFALDAALTLLERQGVVRQLSSPSLMVLSGEQAQFQVGGEVPIPVSFVPAFGGTTANASAQVAAGLVTGVEFRSFGIQLSVRPLVDDQDAITLDVLPQIVNPDPELTASIRQITGTSLTTTAFSTRALKTSSRLQDGQSLVLAGLYTQSSSENSNSAPAMRDIPLLGWLFRGVNKSEDSTELVVIVNPVIVRDPVASSALWAYPDVEQILHGLSSNSAPPSPKGGR